MNDCRSFETRLEALLEGRLSAWDNAAMGAHADCCPHCAELRRLATGDIDLGTERGAPDLTAAVLARTGEDPCARAHALLPNHVDGSPPNGIDGALLADHLAHCADCTALERTLVLLGRELPLLARLDPGPDFAGRVIDRTCGAAATRGGNRFAVLWQAWLRRPRFAWESAYVATSLLCVVLALQGTALSAAPDAARELVSLVRPERTDSGDTVWRMRLNEVGHTVWEVSAGEGIEQVGQVHEVIEERVARTSQRRAALKQHGNELAKAVSDLDATRGISALRRLGGDLGALVRYLIGADRETEGSDERR